MDAGIAGVEGEQRDRELPAVEVDSALPQDFGQTNCFLDGVEGIFVEIRGPANEQGVEVKVKTA